MSKSRLDDECADGHRVLDSSLVDCRHNATIGSLGPSYERAKDD